jgi:hypothetical protein
LDLKPKTPKKDFTKVFLADGIDIMDRKSLEVHRKQESEQKRNTQISRIFEVMLVEDQPDPIESREGTPP